ncbi:MAG: hypothetical protein KatS3mg070_2711 [Meiothermus sp.]|uniref:tetratricopeptide repeat protein n=1 Tax=Meiothermus sp. TaxID=1955249 RepID=UPI0021DC6AAB|nr:tetratricopeptide repeat protein [Meiothermus sp.]GIW29348.1 MAG: hypothetical protein KatS3mg070_2711 [Meiothermus sp.]
MIEVTLLGRLRISWRDHDLGLRGKTQCMVALLALHPQGLSRAELTELLWEEKGRGNLRQALYLLRQIEGVDTWLREEEERLWVLARHDLENPSLEQLRQPFWPDLPPRLPDSFLEWHELQRRKLEELRRERLWQATHEQPQQAAQYLRELLDIDPLHETAAQSLIRLETNRGNPQVALQVFEELRRRLKEELNTEPLESTLALVQSVRAGQTLPDSLTSGQLTLAQRLWRAKELLKGNWSASFWGEVLDADPFDIAEAEGYPAPANPPSTQPAVKKLLCGRIAAALERLHPDQSLLIAEQWLNARETDRALPWFLRAGQAALAANQYPLAERCFFFALWLSQPGAERLEALTGLSLIAETHNNLDLLEAACQELGRLARLIQDDLAFYQFHHRSANAYIRRGRPLLAIQEAEQALQVAHRLNRTDLQQSVSLTLGAARMAEGQLEAAEVALGYARHSEEPTIRLRALGNLGAVYGMQGRLELSLEYLEQALTLARASGKLAITASVLQNLAVTAEKMGRYSRAIEGFREALEVGRRMNDPRLEAFAFRNLALVYGLLGQLGAAWNTLSETLELTERINPSLHAQTLCLLGELESQLGQPQKALEHTLHAQELAQAAKDHRAVLSARLNVALIQQDWLQAETLLAELEAAKLHDLALRGRIELMLQSPDPKRLGLHLNYPFPETPYFGLLRHITQARLALLSFQPYHSAALEAMLEGQEFSICRTGHQVLAELYDREGLPAKASTVRAGLWALALRQSCGLPKTLREQFMATLFTVTPTD